MAWAKPTHDPVRQEIRHYNVMISNITIKNEQKTEIKKYNNCDKIRRC